MNYPFNLINSIAECDELVRMAQRDKAVAENKKSNLTFQANLSAGTTQNRSFDLQQAQADLVNVQNQMTAEVPDSVDWRKLESKRRDLDSRIYKLELSQSLSVGVNSIERAYEINVLTGQIAEADALITGAETRKTELS